MFRKKANTKKASQTRTLRFESLEERRMMTASPSDLPVIDPTVALVAASPTVDVAPAAAPTSNNAPANITPDIMNQPQISLPYTFDTVYTPSQIRTAYDMNGMTLDGTGQTIAIVDAYNDPNITADLAKFDQIYGIAAAPQFTKYEELPGQSFVNGTAGNVANGPAYNSDWVKEISLDVEWAHAMAPKANIMLVEATDPTQLYYSTQWAAKQSGVSVVSMSWGSAETSSTGGEAGNDWYFAQPANHSPVTFVAASGDTGAVVQYPAVVPGVLAVGGTTLNLDDVNYRSSETAWNSGGGGQSLWETEPSYQTSVQNSGHRQVPDVSYDADPGTGFNVWCSSEGGAIDLGGTSAGAPQWAAFVAMADQSRAQHGLPPLAHAAQDLYAIPSTDFDDITSGSNGHAAKAGFDLATGRGTPEVYGLVLDLANSEHALPSSVGLANITTIGNVVGPTSGNNTPVGSGTVLGSTTIHATVVTGDALPPGLMSRWSDQIPAATSPNSLNGTNPADSANRQFALDLLLARAGNDNEVDHLIDGLFAAGDTSFLDGASAGQFLRHSGHR